jgi:hypothetical protein
LPADPVKQLVFRIAISENGFEVIEHVWPDRDVQLRDGLAGTSLLRDRNGDARPAS